MLALQQSAGNRVVARMLRGRAAGRRQVSRAVGEQTDAELMWRQLKETVTSPTELFSYTPLGWSENDWRNAGKTLVGYAKGVGQVIAAPGILTYYATGSLLYRTDPKLYSHYKEHDEVFSDMAAALAEGFKSLASAVAFVAEGVTAGLDQMTTSLRAGDAEGAGEGLGNFTMSVLTAAEGSQGGKIGLVFEPSTAAVATAGVRLVLIAPPNAVPAAVTLMSNAAHKKAGKARTKKPKQPRNRRKEGTHLPEGSGNLEPGRSQLGEGDIDTFGSGSGKKGERVGDLLEMHEPWQNSDLVDRMVARARGVGASRGNPAVALGKELHDEVTAQQRALKVFDKAHTAMMTAREVIETNAQAMRNAGVRNEIVQESRKEALRYAAKHGRLGKKELAKIAADEGWSRTLDIDLD